MAKGGRFYGQCCDEETLMNRPTEPCRMQVSALQQRLAKKATSQPEHRFTKLYDLLTWEPLMAWAFDTLMANYGSHPTGLKWAQEQSTTIITQLRSQLKAGTYQHQVVRRASRPGKPRPPTLPTLIDQLVQLMVQAILEPIVVRDFCPGGHSARTARAAFQELIAQQKGSSWVIVGAIANCFDQIQHQTLLRLLRRRIRDARLLRLSGQLLRAGVMAEGGSIATLLANIYLHELDTWFQHEQRWWQQQGDARYIRTADSFVVTWSGTRSGATRLQAEVATFLQEQLGLELPADRVHIRPLARGFDLLGYRVRRCAGRGTSAQSLIIRPSPKSVMQLKVRIRALTGRETTRGGVEEKISAMNRLLQNWASSYPEVTSRSSFQAMGRYAFKRMAIWLRKKSRQRVRAVYRAYYRKSGAYRTWAAGGVALQLVANAPETDRRTGEPDAPKGARPVRRGAWGDVPTGNAPGAYSTLGYWAGTLREHA